LNGSFIIIDSVTVDALDLRGEPTTVSTTTTTPTTELIPNSTETSDCDNIIDRTTTVTTPTPPGDSGTGSLEKKLNGILMALFSIFWILLSLNCN
jgi:hypothetical protein